ncbi:MAG: hypothetical protein KKD35_02060 [Elusimicrobia bacterium]|nr:hypothetical protein [Elusimicrobiota bacterium]
MTENINKEKPASKKKSLWWLQLSFLFLFLGGGGFYAYVNMNKEAHKLVGGDKYADMSESKIYNSKVSDSKRNFFFSSEEEDLSNSNSASKSSPAPFTALEKKELEKGSSKISGMDGDDSVENSKENYSTAQRASSSGGNVSNSLKQRLAIKKDRVFSGKGTGAKTSGSFLTSSKGEVSIKENEETTDKKGKTVAAKKTSVMEVLKQTWKTGIYGARDASRDAAKSWIARTFDNVAPSRYSLEYEENVKKDLDRIAPSSIPGYLRDMDVNKSSAKKLGIKDVGTGELDLEGTKEALDKDVKYQAAKTANDLSGGMVNSMFSGMDFGEGAIGGDAMDEEDKPDSEDDNRAMPMSEPEDYPELFEEEMMDFGGGGGCGEECGCTCAAACCCLPPDYFNDVGDFPDPDPTTMFA